jgi:biotin operon repressor
VNVDDVIKLAVPDIPMEILKLLKKGPVSGHDLAGELSCKPSRIKEAIADMRLRGYLIRENFDTYTLISVEGVDKPRVVFKAEKGQWQHRFGIVGDAHLANKHSRLDIQGEAYDLFARMGIKHVLQPGNISDGDHKFTRPERIIRPGMDPEMDYVIDNYPQRDGIKTYFVAGDDHEGWYQQRECIEIGRYLHNRAREQGRKDLHYCGYAEADLELKTPGGSAVLRLLHPGGGSAYAISYRDQKRVEAYQGGEKPAVEVAGHYHKYNAGYPREVFTLQPGCLVDQTLFMRKRSIQAMVGFCVLLISQDMTDGHVTGVAHQWFPRYDRAFYERRYSI